MRERENRSLRNAASRSVRIGYYPDMTKERPDAELERVPQSLSVTCPNENLVLELAFAIDDPCGVDAILLAKALIEYGRAVPESQRRETAAELQKIALNLAKLPKVPT